ncbi:tetratricopeptide repeat protein [Larkinella soli]|uniref:tetratricopeptide repeat protein n=1 Tax=Larkinella soli TaxID=1770527 RepID=UPI000FFCA94B|nr:tetratricopeptide repeat protein [Larkinella soli]
MRPTLFGKAFRLSVLITCSTLSLTATAQRTLGHTEPEVHFRNGMEWFEKNNYAAARQEFMQYLDRKKPIQSANDPDAVTAEYYIALSGLYMDIPEAEVQVDRFVKSHREHPKANLLYGDLGKYYFDKGDFDRSITYLEKAIRQNQNSTKQAESKYLLAMAYYSKQDLRQALPLLNQIKQDPGLEQAASASYYAGVINFRLGNFTEALSDFRRVEKNPTYQNEVPNWIVQSLYKAGRYDELLSYAQPLLQRNRTNTGPMAEVALFTAEVFYKKADYAKAASYYKLYSNTKGRSVPAAVQFRYGDALFKTGDYAGAINALKNVSAGKDTVAQYSAYRLGISYLQTQNPSFALNAFDQAARLGFNKPIQEESAFNHAKLQLDLNNGGDAVKEFTDFLRRYPDSRFENEANELLSEAYFSSNNYTAAISYIERLKRRTPRINASYQRITYNQAVNDFNAERYAEAIANFDKSLQAPVDNDLRNSALFWKAETYSALRKYDEAIPLYQQVLKTPSAELQGKSLYALGYASYNKKNYAQAVTYFRDFISKSGSQDKQAIEDATVRVADSYFANKNYNEAMRYYDQAIAQGRIDRDYATFQKGVILAFMERDVEARAQFEKLLTQFPNSRYADDALYQAANVDFEKGSYQTSIRGFSRLINEKPKSYLIPAALLKRATAYSNLQTYEQAIQDYRRILQEFGGSPSASGALLGLQNALSDAGRSEEFSSVLSSYKKSNPGSTDVQKVEYENAKSLYFNEKYPQAVNALLQFIEDNAGSPLVYEARYYLADSYFRSGDPTNALRYYYLVMSDNKSEFVTRAAARAGEVERQQKNYPRAIRNYRTVLSQSNSKNEQASAQIGLMETYYATGNYDSTLIAAREVLTIGNVIPGAQNRAQLMLGKVFYAKGDYKQATTEFEKTIALAKDEQGAEANFWIGDILYRSKKHKESIDVLLRFNSDFTQSEYWKGKAFILVADNNVAQNEIAQAKAVLNSIIENAENPEIVTEAKQKLSALDNRN